RLSLLQQLDAGLATNAEALSALVEYELGGIEFELEEEHEQSLGDLYFELRQLDGQVVKRSDSLLRENLAWPASLPGPDEAMDVALPGDRAGRMLALEVTPRVDERLLWIVGGTADPPPLLLLVAHERDSLDAALTTLRRTLLGVGAAFGILAAALVAFGVNWALRPLQRLRRVVGKIEAHTLGEPIDASGVPGELTPVYTELNAMLCRVEQALERERAFASAAAHELRTPLAELLASSDVGLRFPEEEQMRASLKEAGEIGREMQRIVEALLLISRGRTDADHSQPQPTLLRPRLVALLARDRLAERQLELETEVPEEAALDCEGPVLEIILRNLIDNALTYTATGGAIQVTANQRTEGVWVLEIENGPTALTEAQLPHLFEPFWREEESRTDRAHVGLGLAVVRHLAGLSGLAVSASLHEDRLCMRLEAAVAHDS
ncbi:MAG: ATP-binding protein, partial [Phycisphaerales bacterium JB038]